MPYILNIHTTTETAVVNLTSSGEVLGTCINIYSNEHAAFLHYAIQKLLKESGVSIKKLNAIGVSTGPGSYTGIRIGLAAANGLSYALKIPMITYNALELLATTTLKTTNLPDAFYCPMIDARRMEVYTALYNYEMQEIIQPSAMILEEDSFRDKLDSGKVIFSGSGSEKFKKITKSENAFFVSDGISTDVIAEISLKKYQKKDFVNIPYAKPLYIKDFHTIIKK